MSQNQMWSCLPFNGSVYPLIFNVIINMISFSLNQEHCFSAVGLSLVSLFLDFLLFLLFLCFPFLAFFLLMLWKVSILLYSYKECWCFCFSRQLIWTLTVSSVLPVEDSRSNLNEQLLAFLQTALSLLHACIVQESENWAKLCTEFEVLLLCVSLFLDPLLTFQEQWLPQNLWSFRPERQQIFWWNFSLLMLWLQPDLK